MTETEDRLAASVQARLVRHAKAIGADPNVVLVRYAYRPETVIAEKLHAMVVLAARNSRMRDFFDIHALAARLPFEGGLLVRAIRATFDRRRTRVPADLPIALSPPFAELPDKRAQWRAFLRKNALSGSQPELDTLIEELARFLLPPLAAAAEEADFEASWSPGGPWRS